MSMFGKEVRSSVEDNRTKQVAFNTQLVVNLLGFLTMSGLCVAGFADKIMGMGVVFLLLALAIVLITAVSPVYYVFTEQTLTIVYCVGLREVIPWREIRGVSEFGSWVGGGHTLPYYSLAYPHVKKLPFWMRGEVAKTRRTKQLMQQFQPPKQMALRLKSNFRNVWPDLVSVVSGFVAFFGGIYALPVAEAGKFVVCLLMTLLFGAMGIFSLVEFLRNWQWVTVDEAQVTVRCVLFEIRSIPLSQIKRCWVCRARVASLDRRGAYRDHIIIDTAKTRKQHTISDGYSHKKRRYIILPDTPENREALRRFHICPQ